MLCQFSKRCVFGPSNHIYIMAYENMLSISIIMMYLINTFAKHSRCIVRQLIVNNQDPSKSGQQL